jgi:5-methylthioadenosine/S-adenosylhomocysteine deaminase
MNEQVERPTTCDLLIDDCMVLFPDLCVKPSHSIAIEGNQIKAIGPSRSINRTFKPKITLEANGKFATPGFINAHHHLQNQLIRGGVADEMPIIWERILAPLHDCLSDDDTFWSGMLGTLQMAKSGITCFVDVDATHPIPLIEAIDQSGIRATIAPLCADSGTSYRPHLLEPAHIAIGKIENLYNTYHQMGNGRIEIAFNVTDISTSSGELLRMSAEAAKEYETMLSIHVAEHPEQTYYSYKEFGMGQIDALEHFGLLAPNLLMAHSVRLADREIMKMAEYDVKPVHCPEANLDSHGIPKTPTLLAMGLKVGIGIDGASEADTDMLRHMWTLRNVIKARFGLPIFDPIPLPMETLYKMSTIYGAAALQLEDDIGTIEVGKKADIVLFNWDEPHLSPSIKPFVTLMQTASARDVSDVVIDGQIVVKDRKHQFMDEEEVMAKAYRQMVSVLSKMKDKYGVDYLSHVQKVTV